MKGKIYENNRFLPNVRNKNRNFGQNRNFCRNVNFLDEKLPKTGTGTSVKNQHFDLFSEILPFLFIF